MRTGACLPDETGQSLPVREPTVVLLRGLFGFSRLLWWEYFHGAPTLLESMGFRVIVPRTPWGEGIERRAAFLARELEDVPGPLHLIGHSMGGLDARRFITHLSRKKDVASLTTISTPHRGTALADSILQLPHSPWHRVAGIADLTREAMARFNTTTPDMPGVVYRSYSACRPVSELPWLVRPQGRRLGESEGDNDTLVSVASARWGEHIATLRADHFELIGSRIWLNPFRRRTPFDHLRLYHSIGEWIADTESQGNPPRA